MASVIWHPIWRISGATIALINFHRCSSFDHHMLGLAYLFGLLVALTACVAVALTTVPS